MDRQTEMRRKHDEGQVKVERDEDRRGMQTLRWREEEEKRRGGDRNAEDQRGVQILR